MRNLEQEIAERIQEYEHPERIAFSRRYPMFKKQIIFLRHQIRNIQNFFDRRIRYTKHSTFFECVVARHQSILRRTLGNSDGRLQEQKIINLKQAIEKLNGVIIQPGDIFSFWNIVGRPTRERGYVDGMLLANGKIVEGLGGGLCQLSNFLYWIFLHAPIETVERHHHAMDVFPDSGRTLPFGGGATILYNFVDLKIKNASSYPLQLSLWLTDNHLKGEIRSPYPIAQKFHLIEKHHLFIKKGSQYFRYNEIDKETLVQGKVEKIEHIATNFAPVLYEVTDEYLTQHAFTVLDFTNGE